jgi:hypothetical protein
LFTGTRSISGTSYLTILYGVLTDSEPPDLDEFSGTFLHIGNLTLPAESGWIHVFCVSGPDFAKCFSDELMIARSLIVSVPAEGDYSISVMRGPVSGLLMPSGGPSLFPITSSYLFVDAVSVVFPTMSPVSTPSLQFVGSAHMTFSWVFQTNALTPSCKLPASRALASHNYPASAGKPSSSLVLSHNFNPSAGKEAFPASNGFTLTDGLHPSAGKGGLPASNSIPLTDGLHPSAGKEGLPASNGFALTDGLDASAGKGGLPASNSLPLTHGLDASAGKEGFPASDGFNLTDGLDASVDQNHFLESEIFALSGVVRTERIYPSGHEVVFDESVDFSPYDIARTNRMTSALAVSALAPTATMNQSTQPSPSQEQSNQAIESPASSNWDSTTVAVVVGTVVGLLVVAGVVVGLLRARLGSQASDGGESDAIVTTDDMAEVEEFNAISLQNPLVSLDVYGVS